MIELSSREFRRCVTLVIIKKLLRRISHHDRLSPSKVTGRTPAPPGTGDLISGCSTFLGHEVRSWGSEVKASGCLFKSHDTDEGGRLLLGDILQ